MLSEVAPAVPAVAGPRKEVAELKVEEAPVATPVAAPPEGTPKRTAGWNFRPPQRART